MVLISIDPFASRRIFLILAALLCFSAFCFADPVLMAQRFGTDASETGYAHNTPRLVEPTTILGLNGVDLRSRGQRLLPHRESVRVYQLFFSVPETVGWLRA